MPSSLFYGFCEDGSLAGINVETWPYRNFAYDGLSVNLQRVHSKTPARNRLAKVLPEEWRKSLVGQGVPRRKYTAVCRITLAGGRVIENAIVEEGWIIALDKSHLAGLFEQRIDFDPRTITSLEIKQVV